ncbi:MAG TPA: hypothetical protein VGS21_04040 [Acidimicrobiales bacterium]|nr:hypothetical protein [Acidimicrobiales bacterium]
MPSFPGAFTAIDQARINVHLKIQQGEAVANHVDEAKRLRHERHMAALHRRMAQIEAALHKHHEGTYGECDGCGAVIAEKDLEHDPSHTLCRSCRGHEDA